MYFFQICEQIKSVIVPIYFRQVLSDSHNEQSCHIVIWSNCEIVKLSLCHMVQTNIFQGQERTSLVSMGFASHLANMLAVGLAVACVSLQH